MAMTTLDTTDVTACFVAIINALEKHGMPRELIVEAAQERLLTLDGTVRSDLALLRGLATMRSTSGRD
jgi:hypothetical protein